MRKLSAGAGCGLNSFLVRQHVLAALIIGVVVHSNSVPAQSVSAGRGTVRSGELKKYTERRKPSIKVRTDSSFDIGLTPEQIKRLKALQTEYRPRYQEIAAASRKSSLAGTQAKLDIRKLHAEYQGKYNAVLTKEQLVKLDSLAIAVRRRASKRSLDAAKQSNKRGQVEARRKTKQMNGQEGR